jgi:hypothetical protein
MRQGREGALARPKEKRLTVSIAPRARVFIFFLWREVHLPVMFLAPRIGWTPDNSYR